MRAEFVYPSLHNENMRFLGPMQAWNSKVSFDHQATWFQHFFPKPKRLPFICAPNNQHFELRKNIHNLRPLKNLKQRPKKPSAKRKRFYSFVLQVFNTLRLKNAHCTCKKSNWNSNKNQTCKTDTDRKSVTHKTIFPVRELNPGPDGESVVS